MRCVQSMKLREEGAGILVSRGIKEGLFLGSLTRGQALLPLMQRRFGDELHLKEPFFNCFSCFCVCVYCLSFKGDLGIDCSYKSLVYFILFFFLRVSIVFAKEVWGSIASLRA